MTEQDKKYKPSILEVGRNIVQERFFFFLLVIILSALTLALIWPYITSILAAIALVVLIKPVYSWLESKPTFTNKPNRTTAVTLILFLLAIAIPFIIFTWMGISQATSIFNQSTPSQFSAESITSGIDSLMSDLESVESTPFESEAIVSNVQDSLSSLANSVAQSITSLMSWVAQFLTSLTIVLVIMYVLLPKFKTPKQSQIEAIIPFPKDITNLYIEKVQLMIMAMFKGTFFISFIQGLAMGIVFFIAGVPYTFFLSIVSMFLSLLPMIGISLIAWPIGIVLILSGHIWQGLFVIAMFLIIVANIDVVLRPILVPKEVELNPALVILSVLGGIKLMGIIGLIYGPVIMILLITSIEVYTKYIMRSDLEPFMNTDGSLNLKKMGLKAETTDSNHSTMLQQISDALFKKKTNEKP